MNKTAESTYAIPSDVVIQHACKIAITEDKPILLDYWPGSCDNTVLIGVRDNDEKLLVKNEQEYTSPIQKIYKVDTSYLVLTENSIYIVLSDIATKKIS